MQKDKEKIKKEFKNRLYSFILKLIKFIDSLPNDSITKTLSNQLIRSSTSIIGNYIEGQSSSSKKDFTNYFTHCLKSTNESKLWISLLRDSKRINMKKPNETDWFLKELDEFSKIYASSILKLKGRK